MRVYRERGLHTYTHIGMHTWVVPKTRVPFWYSQILGAVIYSITKGFHNFENNPHAKGKGSDTGVAYGLRRDLWSYYAGFCRVNFKKHEPCSPTSESCKWRASSFLAMLDAWMRMSSYSGHLNPLNSVS